MVVIIGVDLTVVSLRCCKLFPPTYLTAFCSTQLSSHGCLAHLREQGGGYLDGQHPINLSPVRAKEGSADVSTKTVPLPGSCSDSAPLARSELFNEADFVLGCGIQVLRFHVRLLVD